MPFGGGAFCRAHRDREKIAQRLNDQRPRSAAFASADSGLTPAAKPKTGASETETFAPAELISRLPNLTLRGLMSIPENVDDYAAQLAALSN